MHILIGVYMVLSYIVGSMYGESTLTLMIPDIVPEDL